MGVIVDLFGHKVQERHTPHEEFALARRTMNKALLSWLQTKPNADDVQDEIDATIAVVRGLRDLLAADGGER